MKSLNPEQKEIVQKGCPHMKNTIFVFILVALSSLLLCACENKADSKSVEAAKPAAEKDVAPAAAEEQKPKQAEVAPAEATVVPDKVIVYYFHGDFRCPTCTKMEALADKTIKERFAAELASGKLEWKVINVDQADNRHFTQDYNLYTKSLIISAIKDGAQVKWKNCEKTWEHVRNPPEYEDYVTDEIKAYMSGV